MKRKRTHPTAENAHRGEAAPQFQPRMLILARESRGWTQKELADEVGITQSEISKMESGLRAPSSELLRSLATRLHYPTSFFSQTDPIYGAGLSELFHRKRQDIAAKTLAKIHATINIRRIHVSRLLRSIDIPECRIPKVDIEEYAGPIEDIARRVRSSWNLPRGPIENLSGAIEDAGGMIIPCEFETQRVDAVSQWIPPLPPLFFLNMNLTQDRLRFTLAHELGHMIMHQAPHSNIDPNANPGVEKQADVFAAEFLMPERDIKPDLRDISLQRLAVLKPHWRVAMSALLKRSSDLGTIGPSKAKALWVQLSSLGYRTREPVELDIKCEQPSLLMEALGIHRDALGYSLEEMGQLLNGLEDEIESIYYPKKTLLRVVV